MPPAAHPPSPPEGLIIDLVTPLTADGRLDRESLSRLLARVAPLADGLMAGSPLAGEGLDLPLATRRELLSQVLAQAGPVPVFFCITGHTPEATRELAEAVLKESRGRKSAAPVFLTDLPLWYHSNRGLPQAYQALLQDLHLPLILLNFPEVVRRRAALFRHRNLRTTVFKKLAGLAPIAGLIYRGEMRRFLNYHHAAARRPGLVFYEADEVNFLTRPGGWGVVSAGAQLLPHFWRQGTRACLHPEEMADDPEGRVALFGLTRQLLHLARLCRRTPAALIKHALAAQGVIANSLTAPGTPPGDPSHMEELPALLSSLGTDH
jgi:dihydrodipicolinate synthase/N-acetylneuraminate lyase